MAKLSKKLMPLIWILVFIVILPAMAKNNTPDSDTFFIAATGRYIVENGEVPTINPFVIHENFGIVIQQWGIDVIVYTLYNAFGNFGLLLYILVAYSLFLFALWKYIGLYTEKALIKNLVILLAGCVFLPYATARPTVITATLLISFLFFLEKYYRTRKWQWLIVLPVISLLLINLHASMFVMPFVYSLPFFVPAYIPKKGEWKDGIKSWWKKHRIVFLFIVVCVLCGFINPYGLDGMLYLVNSYGAAKGAKISEMAAPTIRNLLWWPCALSALFTAIFFLVNIKKINKENTSLNIVAKTCMAAGAVIMGFMHIRNEWFLIVGVVPVLISLFEMIPPPGSFDEAGAAESGEVPPPEKPLKPKNRICGFIALVVAFTLALTGGIIAFATNDYSQDTAVDSFLTPYKALEYLEAKDKNKIVLYTDFNDGAFFEWYGYKVYLDARPELFAKKINGQKDVMQESLDLMDGKLDCDKFIDDYGFTHVIVIGGESNPLYSCLTAREDFELVVSGEGILSLFI